MKKSARKLPPISSGHFIHSIIVNAWKITSVFSLALAINLSASSHIVAQSINRVSFVFYSQLHDASFYATEDQGFRSEITLMKGNKPATYKFRQSNLDYGIFRQGLINALDSLHKKNSTATESQLESTTQL